MKSLAGKFLLASPTLDDPNFTRAVVYIVRHDEIDGALGFVVNRPLPLTLAAACGPSLEAAIGLDDPVFSGGPCRGSLFVIFIDETYGGEDAGVVRYSAERAVIEALLRDGVEPLKFLVSYAGWTSGQLEGEIETGSWEIVEPAAPDEIFSLDRRLWERLHTRLALSRFVDPRRIPDDPSVN